MPCRVSMHSQKQQHRRRYLEHSKTHVEYAMNLHAYNTHVRSASLLTHMAAPSKPPLNNTKTKASGGLVVVLKFCATRQNKKKEKTRYFPVSRKGAIQSSRSSPTTFIQGIPSKLIETFRQAVVTFKNFQLVQVLQMVRT